MIKVEYSTWNSIKLSQELHLATTGFLPRKNEIVTLKGNDYRVERVFHEPEYTFKDSEGREDQCHKVTVKLEMI